jgi:hypothetical protein
MPRGFSPEELEELRRFDEEIDRNFVITHDEIELSRKLDIEAMEGRTLPEEQSIRDSKAKYRERNASRIASYNASYYKANKDAMYAVKKLYRANNRESYNAYIKEWRRKNKEDNRG